MKVLVRLVGLLGGVGVFFLLSACSILTPVNMPAEKNYILSDPYFTKAIKKSNHNKIILLVSMPTAPEWLNTQNMVYQIKPYQINYFAQHQWAAPPPNLLQPLIVHGLQQSGLYRAVVSAPFDGNADERLDTRIIDMQQDFTSKPSYYDFAVQVQLINLKTGNIINTQRFFYIMQTPTDNPQGGVDTANKAVKSWIQGLIDFCRKSPANM